MAKKYRLTGCAKFFIVLIILVPLSLFIASMFLGVDPVDAIRDAWQTEMGPNRERANTSRTSGNNSSEETLDITAEELDDLRLDAEFFEKEAKRLQAELDACQNAKQ